VTDPYDLKGLASDGGTSELYEIWKSQFQHLSG
jgi:hypothetical protein